MAWFEVLAVRLHYGQQRYDKQEIKSLVKSIDCETARLAVRLLRSESISTDVLVVLMHKEGSALPNGSALAMQLAEALREFGQVNQSSWSDLRDEKTRSRGNSHGSDSLPADPPGEFNQNGVHSTSMSKKESAGCHR